MCFAMNAEAQTPCDAGRYSTELFSSVTETTAIQFGQNVDFIGFNQNLLMDIYEPTGDTETARPLIIFAHGGSFIGGTRNDPDVDELCTRFAKRGFVCASIDYRVGMWPIDSTNAVKAVVRAVQDLKAAVRYFYMDAAATNTYGIDTNFIVIGGSSAGAITALHTAYLDQDCEVEPYITTTELNNMGGIEGTSGNPGYSTDIVGVINLAGALASYGWLEAGDVPLVSMHGDVDGTVPYSRGQASVSGFNVIYMDGSRILEERASQEGVTHKFYTHYAAGHAPYAVSAAYMDTSVNVVTDFLTDLLSCTVPDLQTTNSPTGTAILHTLFYCGLSVNDLVFEDVLAYPNPSTGEMTIDLASNLNVTVRIIDFSGRVIKELKDQQVEFIISKDELGAGGFLLQLTNEYGEQRTEKVLFR